MFFSSLVRALRLGEDEDEDEEEGTLLVGGEFPRGCRARRTCRIEGEGKKMDRKQDHGPEQTFPKLLLQPHPPRNLPGQNLPLESLPTQLSRLLRPNIHRDPPPRQRSLQGPDSGFDPSLVTYYVIQLLSNHRGRGKHVVNFGDFTSLGTCVGRGDAFVGFAEGGL